MSKKLLIISYTFPPSNRIGGRRWVKFGKYLMNQSVDIQVITSKYNNGDGWLKDFNLMKDKINYLSFNYPKYLGISPTTFFQKIVYRIALFYSKIKTDKNYYDKSVHGKIQLINKVKFFIKKGYNNIVVSVAPFHLATHISYIIDDYPNVNFIVDFRDPWIENKTSYGYYSLTEKRQNNERESEKNVVEKFNYVITVSNYITDKLKERYPKSRANFLTIPNGYDKEDFKSFRKTNKTFNKINQIRLIFTGTFYDNAVKYLDLLSKWLFDIKYSNLNLYDSIYIDFYGTISFENKIFANHKNILFHGFKNRDFVNSKILESDACLLFLTDDINYSFSSKFCDYIALEKPILVFSNEGPTSNYVVENKIGESLSVNTSFSEFTKILSEISNNPKQYYSSFKKHSFDLKEISKKYLKIIR